MSDNQALPRGESGCGLAPLTFVQESYFGHIQRQEYDPDRSIPIFTRFRGSLSIECLRRSVELLLQKHEALRTRIVSIQGAPVQQIDGPGTVKLPVVETVASTVEDRETVARRIAGLELRRRIDFTNDSLFNALLLRLATTDHVLIMCACHIVADGMSIPIIRRDLLCTYNRLVSGGPAIASDNAYQLGDHARWLRDPHRDGLQGNVSYWNERLSNAQSLCLPADHTPSGPRAPETKSEPIELGPELSSKLSAMAKAETVTLAMLVFSIYVAAMARRGYMHDFVVPLVVAGRPTSQYGNAVGCFAYRLHLRIVLPRVIRFRDLLGQVVAEYSEALRRQDFGRVELEAPQFAGVGAFNWLSSNSLRRPSMDRTLSTPARGQQLEGFDYERDDSLRSASGDPLFRFALCFRDGANGISGELGYRKDIWRTQTMSRIANEIKNVAQFVVRCPSATVASLQSKLDQGT